MIFDWSPLPDLWRDHLDAGALQVAGRTIVREVGGDWLVRTIVRELPMSSFACIWDRGVKRRATPLLGAQA